MLFFVLTGAAFVMAAYPALTGSITEPGAVLTRFLAPAVLLLVAVVFSAFDAVFSVLQGSDIETWIFVGAVLTAFIVFVVGAFVPDKETKAVLYKAAFSIGGFAIGLRVGGTLDRSASTPKKKTPRKTTQKSVKTDTIKKNASGL